MEGASNSKKRQICYDEEEEEEAKIEKFFALVKSIRESRERLINFGSDAHGETENGNKMVKNRVEVWRPQFQIEDFMEVEPHPPLNLALAGASHKKGATEEKEGEKGMDLSLSL